MSCLDMGDGTLAQRPLEEVAAAVRGVIDLFRAGRGGDVRPGRRVRPSRSRHALKLFADGSSMLGFAADHLTVEWFPAGGLVIEQGEAANELFMSGIGVLILSQYQARPRHRTWHPPPRARRAGVSARGRPIRPLIVLLLGRRRLRGRLGDQCEHVVRRHDSVVLIRDDCVPADLAVLGPGPR